MKLLKIIDDNWFNVKCGIYKFNLIKIKCGIFVI